MRYLTVVIFLLLVQADLNANQCQGKNPFLTAMSSSDTIKVRLFSSPVYPTNPAQGLNSCGSEWRTYSNCCNAYDLNRYAYVDGVILSLQANLIFDQLYKIDESLPKQQMTKLTGDFFTQVRKFTLWRDY